MRKYIFLAVTALDIIPAIRIMLCCRLIIISLMNSPCHVPTMNFLMKTSSTAVSDGRKPPLIFAENKIMYMVNYDIYLIVHICRIPYDNY